MAEWWWLKICVYRKLSRFGTERKSQRSPQMGADRMRIGNDLYHGPDFIRAVKWMENSALAAGLSEALSIVGFALGDLAEQVAVGLGTEGFRTVAIIMEEARGESARRILAVFDFQAIERGEGNAISTIEMA
jgi:hypothetical protein